MRTLGVDLAKAATTTALCMIRWEPGRAVVESVRVNVDDDAIVKACGADGVRAVALDAPFGWPRAMVAAVTSWRPGGRWARPSDDVFRLRDTDHWVAKHTRALDSNGAAAVTPLSVSADKIVNPRRSTG